MEKRPCVLIADDEEGIRESLRLILDRDYEVEFAQDGTEVMAKLSKNHIDLLMLDIKMPRMDGVAVMRELYRKRMPVRVLILTAYQSVEFAKEAIKLGAIDYLPKPFERKDVLEAVRDALLKPVPARS